MRYQNCLVWLAGLRDLYSPEHWVSRAYPSGHFDRPLTIQYGEGDSKEMLLLSTESFQHVLRTSVRLPSSVQDIASLSRTAFMSRQGIVTEVEDRVKEEEEEMGGKPLSHQAACFIHPLYFVTRMSSSTSIDSVPSKLVHWILSKVSTEDAFDAELRDVKAVEELRLRALQRYEDSVILTTQQLLDIYEENNILDQIFVVHTC